MDFNLEKKRFQLVLIIAGVIALSITDIMFSISKENAFTLYVLACGLAVILGSAEKCRQLVGEEAASKSGKFTFLNCFDLGTGTLACSVKEGVKLYINNIHTAHSELARSQAMQNTLNEAISRGMSAKDAAKQAEKEGKKAAKLASRQARRITGPIIASGWDFFEAIYFGGSMTEGFLRGSGTLVGTYALGFVGEQRVGRFGYLVGSQVGSWVGGRIGLMVYDVVNGVKYLLQFGQGELSETYESSENYGSQEAYESSENYGSQDVYGSSETYESREVYRSDEL